MKDIKMRNLTIIAAMLAMVGCSTPSPGSREAIHNDMVKSVDNMPSWYAKPPKDSEALYDRASARSRDMQMAINKALMLARAQMAVTIDGEINATMKLFMDEIGSTRTADVSSQASITTYQDALLVKLSGLQQEDAKIVVEGDQYVAYVLIRYPIGEMNKMLMDRIHQNNALAAKLRASASFKDLERKVEEARKREMKND
jgi:hypothetical protein